MLWIILVFPGVAYVSAMLIVAGLIPSEEEHSKQLSKVHLCRLFFFSLMWSIGENELAL